MATNMTYTESQQFAEDQYSDATKWVFHLSEAASFIVLLSCFRYPELRNRPSLYIIFSVICDLVAEVTYLAWFPYRFSDTSCVFYAYKGFIGISSSYITCLSHQLYHMTKQNTTIPPSFATLPFRRLPPEAKRQEIIYHLVSILPCAIVYVGFLLWVGQGDGHCTTNSSYNNARIFRDYGWTFVLTVSYVSSLVYAVLTLRQVRSISAHISHYRDATEIEKQNKAIAMKLLLFLPIIPICVIPGDLNEFFLGTLSSQYGLHYTMVAQIFYGLIGLLNALAWIQRCIYPQFVQERKKKKMMESIEMRNHMSSARNPYDSSRSEISASLLDNQQ